MQCRKQKISLTPEVSLLLILSSRHARLLKLYNKRHNKLLERNLPRVQIEYKAFFKVLASTSSSLIVNIRAIS